VTIGHRFGSAFDAWLFHAQHFAGFDRRSGKYMKLKLMAVGLAAAVSFPVFAEGPHWGYAGAHGAGHWADMEPGFATCKIGKAQSPINIDTKQVKPAKLDPIGFHYSSGTVEVLNNGHTIQVNVPAGSAITLDGSEYQLVQFHFHTPSEEKINGKNFPLVAHFVHRNAEGKLAVVAVLFKSGKENEALKPVFDAMPNKEGEVARLAAFNPADVLPPVRTYYAFEGSLTTPPCSEDVRWQVLKNPVALSKNQITAFRKLYPMNARPVQPLNGRDVRSGG
jgi:carbonic anhydrase